MLTFSYTSLYLQFGVVGYFLCISWPSPRLLCYFLFSHLLLYCFSCRLHHCFLCNFFSLIPLFLYHFFLEYFNLLSKFRFLLSSYCFLLMTFLYYFLQGVLVRILESAFFSNWLPLNFPCFHFL